MGFRFKPLDLNGVALTVTIKAGQRSTDNFVDIIELGNLIQENNFKDLQRCRISGDGLFPKLKSHIRRLTPKECFRLMGFCGEDVPQGISDTQLYKLAGNSIVVNVLIDRKSVV